MLLEFNWILADTDLENVKSNMAKCTAEVTEVGYIESEGLVYFGTSQGDDYGAFFSMQGTAQYVYQKLVERMVQIQPVKLTGPCLYMDNIEANKVPTELVEYLKSAENELQMWDGSRIIS